MPQPGSVVVQPMFMLKEDHDDYDCPFCRGLDIYTFTAYVWRSDDVVA